MVTLPWRRQWHRGARRVVRAPLPCLLLAFALAALFQRTIFHQNLTFVGAALSVRNRVSTMEAASSGDVLDDVLKKKGVKSWSDEDGKEEPPEEEEEKKAPS